MVDLILKQLFFYEERLRRIGSRLGTRYIDFYTVAYLTGEAEVCRLTIGTLKELVRMYEQETNLGSREE